MGRNGAPAPAGGGAARRRRAPAARTTAMAWRTTSSHADAATEPLGEEGT
ncbi:hypothetical protein [Actinomadura sp. 21ATH]